MKPLIVANWKMNPVSLVEAKYNFELIKKTAEKINKVETVVCAPFVFLSALKPGKNLKLGAQDCFWEEKGAFTGEISPTQLKKLGVEYVILGHSERRRYLEEKTELVNKKIKAALKAGLKIIFCVGSETKKPGKEIEHQLEVGLKGVEKTELARLVLMYEPVWAISTTKNKITATPQEALQGGRYMRKIIEQLFDKKTSQAVKIVYGGSVDSANIKEFLTQGKMAGGLVGAASLNPKEFVDIIKKVCYT